MAHPVQIVNVSEDHVFDFDEQALSTILLQNDVKDRNVVVLSVAGAFRKGKSFILGFFLRYLNAKYVSKNADNWLGSEDAPLTGFSWKGGSRRHTTGILIWSEIFKADLANGEKVAIMLMDTQGVFDTQSTILDSSKIFALSTLLSSVQIYNLSQQVQENDLQHLQLFTEYGRLAQRDSAQTPFQKILFLIRDWSYPYEKAFGAAGGKEHLNEILKVSQNQHPELQSVREHITSCFTSVDCFLMPHPGFKVAGDPKFDGKLSDISPEFKEQLNVLVPLLLGPRQLITKKIDGQNIKARIFIEYFKSYFNIYKSNTLPEPKSILAATAEINNLSAVDDGKEEYTRIMNEICNNDKALSFAKLDTENERVKNIIYAKFTERTKLGGKQLAAPFREMLEKGLAEKFTQIRFVQVSKAEAENRRAVDEAKGYYSQTIQAVCDGNQVFLSYAALDAEHNKIKGVALDQFTTKPKVGGMEFSASYRPQLNVDMDNHFQQCRTVLTARAEANNHVAIDAAKKSYTDLMEGVCGGGKPSLSIADLYAEHLRMKKSAMANFLNTPKMFAQDLLPEQVLDREIDVLYNPYIERNRAKQRNEQLERENRERRKKKWYEKVGDAISDIF